jgi:hypothetical protein
MIRRRLFEAAAVSPASVTQPSTIIIGLRLAASSLHHLTTYLSLPVPPLSLLQPLVLPAQYFSRISEL